MSPATTTRPHGYARYKLDGCRCNTCGWAVSEYSRRRAEAIAAGTWRVDADTVRVHLRALSVASVGYKRVAALAGLNISTVSRILYGRKGKTPPPATTRYDIAQRILAIAGDGVDVHPNMPVEATGTVRRAPALVAIGYTITEVAEAIGWTVQNFSPLLIRGSVPYASFVKHRTAMAVADLYDRWWMKPSDGPHARKARAMARRRRWPSPLAWDDEALDDPAATPITNPPAGDEPVEAAA